MNNQEITNTLRLLKTMKPTKPVMDKMQQNIYQQVGIISKKQQHSMRQGLLNTAYVFVKSIHIAFYGVVFVALLVLFCFISSVFLSNALHTAIVYSQLTFATNQYQRARIALADTTGRFANTKLAQSNSQEFSQSLALANTELNKLKLKGERGKYTAQECQQIYGEYLFYLEKEKGNIQKSFPFAKSQVNAYEEQAEKKLHMYNSV